MGLVQEERPVRFGLQVCADEYFHSEVKDVWRESQS